MGGLRGGEQDLEQAGGLVVGDDLDLVVIGLAHLAVDFRLQRAAGVEELRVLESGASRAGDDVQKVLEIAIGAQRYVLRQHGFELAPRVRSLGLKDGSFRLDGYGFRGASRLKDQVDAPGRVHDYIDAGS